MHTLVIACGNTLRGDDGVAHIAADRVLEWQLPGVRVLKIHQLVPELIADMQTSSRVLFVDASIHPCDAAFQVQMVHPQESRRLFGHHESAENLLLMLRELHGTTPPAWLLTIHAKSFAHGEGLSETSARALTEALLWLREFLVDPPCTKSA